MTATPSGNALCLFIDRLLPLDCRVYDEILAILEGL
jgi:hypothetical protein